MNQQRWEQARSQRPGPPATCAQLRYALFASLAASALAACSGQARAPEDAHTAMVMREGGQRDVEQVDVYEQELTSLNSALAAALGTSPLAASPAGAPAQEKPAAEVARAQASPSASEPLAEAEAPAPVQTQPSAAGADSSSSDTLLSGDLESDYAASPSGCDQAPALRDRICELAERICGIAKVHADDRELQVKCDDGKRSCEHARSAVEEACE